MNIITLTMKNKALASVLAVEFLDTTVCVFVNVYCSIARHDNIKTVDYF